VGRAWVAPHELPVEHPTGKLANSITSYGTATRPQKTLLAAPSRRVLRLCPVAVPIVWHRGLCP